MLVSCDFVVYDSEFCSNFLEGGSVFGVVLPAAVHDGGDLCGAAVRSRHPVPCNTSQTQESQSACAWTPPASGHSLYLSPPRLESAGCSCWSKASFPEKRSPTVRSQSSTHHSEWYNGLTTTAGGSIGKRQASCSLAHFKQEKRGLP